MNNPKPMPVREKFAHAFGMVRLYQKHVLPFVEARLGYAARRELASVWQAAIAPIRKNDPDEEKYNRAYASWLWMARCSHDFVAEQLDREGVADYKRMLLRSYKSHYDNPDLTVYHWLNRYEALVKAWIYEMQWITPIEITHSNTGKFVCEVQHCKVLQTPASERVCKVDCWNVGTELAWQVYHLERQTRQVNHGCMITLIPLED
jgi:hypothetical protein